jgi:hypothetical protein
LLANALGRADRFGHAYAVTEVLWSIAFSAVFVAGGIMAARTGDILDATQQETRRLAGLAAALSAGDGLRTRFDALVHDRVLAVLLNIGIGTPEPALAAEARRVMQDVSELSDPPERIVDMDEFVSLIRAAITGLDANVSVAVRALPAGNNSIDLSSKVIDAVSGATSEAIRNSRRHAGADATVTADIEIDTGSGGHVTVVVEDDGMGFDPTLVRPDRLGLSMSIRQRMREVGGRAVVDSAVGEGTRVTIEWPAVP